ncbi:MAG: hypothetical protein PHG66_06410 [Candidatus Colwellbacteria bacterium]|nr:hypothetical protein [Candidatus Colwellbacteria bacterium]
MCHLSFFASTISDVAAQLDSRADDLQSLHAKGFRDTDKASQYLRLGRDLGYLTTPLVAQPDENLYWVVSTPLVADMVTVLRAEAAKIRSDLAGNLKLTPEEFATYVKGPVTTQFYVSFLREQAAESRRVAKAAADEIRRAKAAAARVAAQTAALQSQMDALLAEAASNLESESVGSSSSAPPMTSSSAVAEAAVSESTE